MNSSGDSSRATAGGAGAWSSARGASSVSACLTLGSAGGWVLLFGCINL